MSFENFDLKMHPSPSNHPTQVPTVQFETLSVVWLASSLKSVESSCQRLDRDEPQRISHWDLARLKPK